MPVAMLPNARVQFLDEDGKPLVGGKVGYYEPGTLTPKTTWQDFDQDAQNDNPLTLDALGSASVWGAGRYRQIVKDSLGNLKWDKETVIAVSQPYEVGFYFVDVPAANDVICVWNFTQAAVFPTNWVGAYGAVNNPPSADIVVTLKLNGSSIIGSMAITSLGVVTFASIISNPEFIPGDRLTVHAPADPKGAAGLSATFLGDLVA